jgi:hypothetical protein
LLLLFFYHRKFYPGGRILHFIDMTAGEQQPSCAGCRGRNDSNFTVVWANRENFQKLIITGRMVLDHLPMPLPRVADARDTANTVPLHYHFHAGVANGEYTAIEV